jgi:hypothetical protein
VEKSRRLPTDRDYVPPFLESLQRSRQRVGSPRERFAKLHNVVERILHTRGVHEFRGREWIADVQTVRGLLVDVDLMGLVLHTLLQKNLPAGRFVFGASRLSLTWRVGA